MAMLKLQISKIKSFNGWYKQQIILSFSRLLYYTVLFQSNCTQNFPPYSSIRAIITLLCSHIFQESILIYKMEFPSNMNDLLVEQGQSENVNIYIKNHIFELEIYNFLMYKFMN